MRRIIKTVGVVMGVLPYRESSVIFRLYTANYGLLTVLARGARRPESPYGGSLRTFVKGDFVLYFSGKGEFYHLIEAQVLTDPADILANEDCYLIASAIVEFIMKISPSGLANPRVFGTLDQYLTKIRVINSWGEAFGNFVSFTIQILQVIGYLPPLDRCVVCNSYDVQYFSVDKGGCFCRNHGSNGIELNRQLVAAIKKLSDGEVITDTNILSTIFDLLEDFLSYHIGDLKFITGLAIDRKRRTNIIG